jgi:ribonuclease BN (tRNA processing enzyme)
MKMKITFLGTNGWFDTDVATTACVLIQTKHEHVILDAGMGFYKIGRLIADDKPIYLFLSHFHLDHLYGIHTFNLFDFKQGIHVYGPKGIKESVGRLMRRPYTKPLNELATKINFHDLARGDMPSLIDVEFRKLDHPVLCYGYRFHLEDKIVAYCTDTGPCDNIVRLAQGADMFISECSFKSGQTSRTWGHLNPELAAQAAKEAGAKRLALMHFDAALYTSLKDRLKAQKAARLVFKRTFAAFDDMSVSV